MLAAAAALLAWVALALALQSVRWSPFAPTAIGTAEVCLAGVAAATATICRHVTGRRAAGHLAAGAALLAASALLALLPPPTSAVAPGALPGWTVPQAVLVAAAGVVLLQALVGPDVDSRSRPVRPLAIGLALSGGLWGVLIGAQAVLDIPAAQRFGGPAALLPVLVWATVLAVGTRRIAQDTDRVAGILTGFATLQLAAAVVFMTGSRWLADVRPLTVLLSVLAWLVVIGALLHLLREEAQQRRCELHLRRVQHDLELLDHERKQRERRHEARNALLALEATTTALWRADLSPTDGDRDELGRITVELVDELRALLATNDTAPVVGDRGRADPAGAVTGHAELSITRLGHTAPTSQASHDAPGGPAPGAPDPAADARDTVASADRLDLAEVASREAAIARAQGLEVQVAATQDALARGDSRHTRQIVRNLLLNVTRHAAGTRPPRATLLVHREGRQVVLRCIDDGPGVPAHLGERVFSPGDRLDAEGSGDGLGLPIARRLARAQGGDLELGASAAGACFVLRLPADLDSSPGRQALNEVDDLVEVREPHQRNPVRPAHRAAPYRTLRIVEDEQESGRGHRSSADGDPEVERGLVIDLDLEVVPDTDLIGEVGPEPAGWSVRDRRRLIEQHLHLEVVGEVPGADEQTGERVGEQPRRRSKRDTKSGRGPSSHTPV